MGTQGAEAPQRGEGQPAQRMTVVMTKRFPRGASETPWVGVSKPLWSEVQGE